MPGHKTTINKLERNEIVQSMFSDQNVMKLEINTRRNFEIYKYVEIQDSKTYGMQLKQCLKGNL